ncbi:MAG: hypothetical protein NTW86_02480 [Candidatus Sumerlaeota bacterium]|nr:hypothetical protein [Candidatus Sumerlaeota bacterium]
MDPRRGVIPILPEDQKRVRLAELLWAVDDKSAPVVWKKRLWGTPRDLEFLSRLMEMPALGKIAGKPKEKKRWLEGQGIQPRVPSTLKPEDSWWKTDRLFLDAASRLADLVLIEADCETVRDRFPEAHRSRDPRIFEPPLVVFSQGFTKVAFCDFPVLFRHSLQSISGPQEDWDLLAFLAAALTSDLARYFLFHTAANWGTERDKVLLHEILRLPFPLPEQTADPKGAKQVVRRVADIIRELKGTVSANSLKRPRLVDDAKDRIRPLVYEYYNVSKHERMLIEDTLGIFEPSSTPNSLISKIATLSRPDPKRRQAYANLLCEVLNKWASRGPYRVSATARVSTRLGLSIVTLTKGVRHKPFDEFGTTEDVEAILRRLWPVLSDQTGAFTRLRGLKVFDEQEPQIHILKPLALRHWTRTAALNDADEIATAILAAKEDA